MAIAQLPTIKEIRNDFEIGAERYVVFEKQ